MKKNILYIVALCMLSSISMVHADIAQFLRVIMRVEDMLDGIIPLDEARLEADLKLLKTTTQSPNRIERINDAYRRFNALSINKRQPAKEQPKKEPLPHRDPERLPETKPQNPVPLPSLEGMTLEQKLETLLLYAKSLASTADLAIKVHQREDAQAAIIQAREAFAMMRDLIAKNSDLAIKFTEPVQNINDRISALQQQINQML